MVRSRRPMYTLQSCFCFLCEVNWKRMSQLDLELFKGLLYLIQNAISRKTLSVSHFLKTITLRIRCASNLGVDLSSSSNYWQITNDFTRSYIWEHSILVFEI
ncbi:uncharacterized protein LOC120087216 isoform X1 [Benincasa hispida]|uniref:uncharacterized protein LOC120087216 isoform X1 n=1 Tax=Benincasa hispida TaxID=102211 RepID=UPI001900FA85|nr:uncharacterized protein LOC120087216 isoform X1 [Benincasa hispida]